MDSRRPATAAPAVSIGLPVYNGEAYLEKTIASLLGQTYRDFELIICDNASTDGTERLCRAAAQRDARVRYHRNQRNLGAAANYNLCFALARGRYFRWNAADDMVTADALQKCVEFLQRNPGFVLAYPRTEIIDGEGRTKESYDDRLDIRDDDPVSRAATVLRKSRECNAVFGLIEATALRGTSLIGRYVGSDHILLYELALRGRFAELPDVRFFRRDHPEASSSDKTIARQKRFYDPDGEDPRFERSCHYKTWRHIQESWRAVRRASLGFRDRMRARWMVFRVGVESRRHLIEEHRLARRGSQEIP